MGHKSDLGAVDTEVPLAPTIPLTSTPQVGQFLQSCSGSILYVVMKHILLPFYT